MSQQLGRRRNLRSVDPLESMIRQALEDRLINAHPPTLGRQILIARARRSSLPPRHSLRRLFDQFRPQHRRGLVYSTLWAHYRMPGPFCQDWHLAVSINNLSNPLFYLMQ
jgi:hypothetical protein